MERLYMRDKKIAMEVFHQIEETAAEIFGRLQIPHQVVDFTNARPGLII